VKEPAMELKQLEYLVTAAEAGSFSNASEVLYTTPSNVSKVIKKLEKRNWFQKLFKNNS